MSNNKKIYFVAIISKLLIIFISLFSSALINRQLGASLKGDYAYITNIVSVLVIIFCMGIGQTYSTIRRKNGNETLGLFLFLTLIHSFISLIISLVLLLIKKNVWFIIFILTSSGVFKTNVLYYAAIEDIKKRDVNNIIYKIIYLIMILAYYFLFPPSVYGLLIITLIEDLLIAILTIKSFKFQIDYKKINFFEIKKIYKLGFLCMVMHCLMTLNYSLDVIFLKNMTSSKIVGLYSVGVSLANMLWLIPDAFKDVLANKTSRNDSVKEIVKVTKYSLYFSLLLVIGFIVFGKLFIKIMYGSEFINSYICTIILFIGCFSMIIYKLIHPIYIANGKQKIVVIILLISVVANIIANLILIPTYSMYGAAIASVISYTLCGLIFILKFCSDYNTKFMDFFCVDKNEITQIIKKIGNKIKKR